MAPNLLHKNRSKVPAGQKNEDSFYQSLPPDKHMRVLSLDRSKVLGERRYMLKARPIDSAEPYFALSYRWRKDEVHRCILINGQRKIIMQTVKEFLDLHFRNASHNQIFIDSICINQNDLDERAAQVRLMGEIYSRAEKVCVWLGNDITMTDRYNLHAVTDQRPLVEASTERRRDLANGIFGKDYWMRVWVMQELLLPKTIEIFWGSLMISETKLQAIVNFGQPEGWAGILRAMTVVLRRRQIRAQAKSPEFVFRESLVQLLNDFRYTWATDPRDQVYALLGMSRDTDPTRPDHLIPVNYSPDNSPADVFCDVMAYCTMDPDDTLCFARRLARMLEVRAGDIRAVEGSSQQYVHARGWLVGRAIGQGQCLDLDTYRRFRHAARKSMPEHYLLLGKDFIHYPTWHQHESSPERPEDDQVSSDDEALREQRNWRIKTYDQHTPVPIPALQPDQQIIGVRDNQQPDLERSLAEASTTIPQIESIDRKTLIELHYPTQRGSVLSREYLEPGDAICLFASRRTAVLALREIDGFFVPVSRVYVSDGYYGKEGKRWAFQEMEGMAEAVRVRMNVVALCDLAL